MFAGIDTVQVNPRRRWTAVVSFTFQASALAVAFVLPLLYPQSLPEAFAHRPIFAPISSLVIGDTTANTHPGSSHGVSVPHDTIFVVHNSGFHFTRPGSDIGPSDEFPNLPPGLTPNAVLPGPPIGNVLPPIVHPTVQPPPRVSRSMQGYLIHRVEPAYPNIAKTAGVQGAVLIKALISTEGRIEQAQVVSGSPLLAKAALEAIQQWRYRPYYLNDRAVEVETEITVNFVLH